MAKASALELEVNFEKKMLKIRMKEQLQEAQKNLSKKHSKSSKVKISQQALGKSHHSEIHKQKLSQKWTENNPNFRDIDTDLLAALIRKGKAAKEIAKELNISYPTVFSKIKKLLGYKTLTEAREKLK